MEEGGYGGARSLSWSRCTRILPCAPPIPAAAEPRFTGPQDESTGGHECAFLRHERSGKLWAGFAHDIPGQDRPKARNAGVRRLCPSPHSEKERDIRKGPDIKDPPLGNPHLGDDGQGKEREVHEGILDRSKPPGMLLERLQALRDRIEGEG